MNCLLQTKTMPWRILKVMPGLELSKWAAGEFCFSSLFCVFSFDFPGSCQLPVPTAGWGNESLWASGKIFTFLKILNPSEMKFLWAFCWT